MPNPGFKMPESTKAKIAATMRAKVANGERWGLLKRDNSGANYPRWKGGRYVYLVKKILDRDNHTCRLCGFREIGIMEVDHITPKAVAPELKHQAHNLMTLCPNCHARKTQGERRARLI